MNKKQHRNLTIRQYIDGDERELVEVLNASFTNGWGSVEDWRWKYKNHENFNPDYIYVVEDSDKIIGCWHIIVKSLKLGHSSMRVSFDGDLAILPSYRLGDIIFNLKDIAHKKLFQDGIPLVLGFTTPELMAGFYTKLFGAFSKPTTYYMKIINNEYFKNEISKIDKKLVKKTKRNKSLRQKIEDINFTIQFDLIGIPAFVIKFVSGRILFEDGGADDADIFISGAQTPLLKAMASKIMGGNKIDLLKAVITRRVRVRGWLVNAAKIYKIYKIVT